MTVARTMRRKLTDRLAPTRLAIIDESHRHAGHAGARPEGETHFAVTVVSAAFSGLNRVARQRLVYQTLSEELAGPVHALSLTTRTPEEEVEIALRQDAVRTALERLPEREREVVRLRYGIDGDDPTPLREAGRRLGISAEEVRRLERRALEELAESRELEALKPAA